MKFSTFVVIALALALCTRALADLDGAKKALETVKTGPVTPHSSEI